MIYFLICSDHLFAGSSSHPLISAASPITSSFSVSQTAPLNVLPAASSSNSRRYQQQQKISATSAIITTSINASRATESHSSLLESSVSRGKDWILLLNLTEYKRFISPSATQNVTGVITYFIHSYIYNLILMNFEYKEKNVKLK